MPTIAGSSPSSVVGAGFARLVAERIQIGSRTVDFSNDVWGQADLTVIVILFLLGMAANAALTAIPVHRKWAFHCMLLSSAVILVLIMIGCTDFHWAMAVLHPASVSGGSD